MKRTNIHLSDAQRNWLQRHGQAVGKHPAAIVREAIDYYRETNERHAQRRAKALTRECRKSDR